MSLKTIAAVLGLSVTIVSRALNGYPDVAQEMRKRIEEEVQRHGDRPDAATRRLNTGRTHAAGFVCPISASPRSGSDFSDMLQALDYHRLRRLKETLWRCNRRGGQWERVPFCRRAGKNYHGMRFSIIPSWRFNR